MKIIVPIKQVPETNAVKMDENTGTMIRDGVESIINPLDLYSIETAIQLKEQHGGEVISISMGPPSAIRSVKESIAMGCDTGYLITDRKFSGADTWATSMILSRAIQKLGDYDLILCGERATDGDTGQVGPCLASFLEIPVLTYVSKISLMENQLIIERLVEKGYETYSSPMPLLATVVKEISYPRLPTLDGKLYSKKMDIPIINNEILKFDENEIGLKGSPTKVVKIFSPRIQRTGEKYSVKTEQDIETAVEKIIRYLETNQLIQE